MRTDFQALHGFATDDLLAACRTLLGSARAVAAARPPLRAAVEPSPAWRRLCVRLSQQPEPDSTGAARRLIEGGFVPYRIEPVHAISSGNHGFLTGYYEPSVDGAEQRTGEFGVPLLARPDAFERLPPGEAARPYAPRASLEADALAGRYPAVVWLRDWVEAFFVQVQGCARVKLPGGRVLRLVYDGRNGQPYASIGRILVESRQMVAGELSLDAVKAWIRAQGQAEGEPGRALMQRNRSYVFFRAEPALADEGPTGGAGVPLSPLRSIAVDRTIWPYGLPFWIDADLPWKGREISRFNRLMVAQDTGSAILGPARADIFFGSGAEAGRRAGDIRHPGHLTVLLPRDEAVAAMEPP